MNSDKKIILDEFRILLSVYKQEPSKKFNAIALQKAIKSIETYDKLIESGEQMKNEFKGIIGDKIAIRIDEILATQHLSELNSLKSSESNQLIIEKNAFELFSNITGVGPVRARQWIDQKIYTLEDLQKKIQDKEIKITHHIEIGLMYYNDLLERIPKDEMKEMNKKIKSYLKKIDKEYIYSICGSFRRNEPSSGDIDILVSHPNKDCISLGDLKKIVEYMKEKKFIIDELTKEGNTKFMGICKIGSLARRIDIRMIPYESYFYALLYFTGSKEFNLKMRNQAISMGMHLSEYSLVNTINPEDKHIVHSEEEIFQALKMEYVKPEFRNI